MRNQFKSGLAVLAVAVFTLTAPAPASAADLPAWNGSLKDAPMMAPAPGCYLRGNIGYSWSDEPNSRYVGNFDNNGNSHPEFDSVSYDDTWLFEGGAGCESTIGIRTEVMFGIRDNQHFEGHIPINTNPDDPILTDITSYTAMLNFYYDLGNWSGITPYVGAGIGFAYHDMGKVVATDPSSPNPQYGDEDLNFAWALMVGFAAQMTQNAVLDVGYRYIDMGGVDSLHADVAGFWNPRLDLDDLTAHEITVGVRYAIDHIF